LRDFLKCTNANQRGRLVLRLHSLIIIHDLHSTLTTLPTC
jgi:hypothetical protein